MVTATQDVPFANVIFDQSRQARVRHIHRVLRAHGIHPCGRYGEWGYLWSDQAVLSGQRVAEQVTQPSPRSGVMSTASAG